MYAGRRGASGRRARIIVAATAPLALVLLLGSTVGLGSAAAAPVSGSPVVNDVVVQADGKIVIVGAKGGNFALTRYTTSGRLDRAFDGDGRVTTDFGAADDSATAVTAQPDGKIVVAGASGGNFAVARYTANGALDQGFSDDGKHVTTFGSPDDSALAVLRQSDGKIVVAGRGVDGFAVARYTAAGAIDKGFGHSGRVGLSGSPVTDLMLQSDDKIVAVGAYVTRLTDDGAVDSTFDTGGLGDGGEGWRRLGGQSDGRIVMAGASDCNFALVGRVDPTGGFDMAFSQNAGLPTGVAAVGLSVLTDDRTLVVSDGSNDGSCTAMPGITFERYLSDGSRDTSFGPGGAKVFDTSIWPAGAAGVPASNVAMAPDGKVVVVGRTYVARFTSSAEPDSSFGNQGVVLAS
jgi:uncharacterized delta-60 repeat protein